MVLIDQSSGYTSFSDDVLNVNCMNVRPGGAQAVLHDTVWNGRAQNIVFSDSISKGMKHIHKEREVYTKGMKPKKCDTSSGQDVRLQVQKKQKLRNLLVHKDFYPNSTTN